MGDNGGDDQNPLPGSSWGDSRAVRGMPAAFGLRPGATGTLPVRRRKADMRPVPGPLLSARTTRAGQGGDALRRTAHALGTSGYEPAPLAGRVQTCADSVMPALSGA